MAVIIGSEFEKMAEAILTDERYTNITRQSHRSPYDIEAYKDGEKFPVEVKGRRASAKTQNFIIRREQHEELKKLPNSLYLLVNKYGYKIIPAVELENLSDSKFLVNIYESIYISSRMWRCIAQLVKRRDQIPAYIREAIHEKLERDGVKMTSKMKSKVEHSCRFSSGCNQARNDEMCNDFVLAYHHCAGFRIFSELEIQQGAKLKLSKEEVNNH